MRPDSDSLYELAEGQGGYFGASQARELGFGSDLIPLALVCIRTGVLNYTLSY